MRRTSAIDAYQNQRLENARWPSREDPGNRLEPIASPAFSPKFKMTRGEAVFTMGSCFARNIEEHLKRLGFRVPMLDLVLPEHERRGGRVNNALNKYNIYSINNAIRMACEEKGAPLYEVGVDEFLDLQLYALTPVNRGRGIERQLQINKLVKSAIHSPVLIITLGLAEVWYDKSIEMYCNISPPWPLVKKQPERFEFRVLGYDEIYRGLKDLAKLLDLYAAPNYRVLLTVSPVPLNSTFTDRDVLVANCYSKSVQRAAVEQILEEHFQFDYFPSFESVTLSDRKLAYETKERTHVTDQLVSVNVERMLAAYC